MSKIYDVVIITLMTLVCCNVNVFAQHTPPSDGIPEHLKKYIPSQVYWQVKAGTEVPVFEDSRDIDESELNQVKGLAEIVENFEINRIEKSFRQWDKDDEIGRTFTIHFKNHTDFEDLLRSLNELSATNLSERIPMVELAQAPNDPKYNTIPTQQWYLPYIGAEEAWAINDCSGSNVVVAVVDDAILTTHQDLAGKIVGGYDVGEDDSDPNPPTTVVVTNTFFSHGTHVAGVIGASTDNGIGMASMGYDCMIMPIKAGKDTPILVTVGQQTVEVVDMSAAFDGVCYAILNGADVINMSWTTGMAFSETQENIIKEAYKAGIICVGAAGNGFLGTGVSQSFYPAAYPHVISVGAINQINQRPFFSNYGTNVDIMAPGVGIESSVATSTSNYAPLDGTSMACAIVSGLAALYLCEYGGDPDISQIAFEQCLYGNALDISSQCPSPSILVQADLTLGCVPATCELVFNGDFEISNPSTLQSYHNTNPFILDQVSGWRNITSSPEIRPVSPSSNNWAFMKSFSSSNSTESIRTTDPLSLRANTTYVLEYDYKAFPSAEAVDHLYFRLSNSTGAIGVGTTIDHQINIPTTNGIQHRTVTFTTPTFNFNDKHLTIYPIQNQGSGEGRIRVDNISIYPFIDITISADEDTVCQNACTLLHINNPPDDPFVVWDNGDSLDDPFVLNPLACPEQTTTYTATVFDRYTGCSAKETVTVVVDNTNCTESLCNNNITVEANCIADSILLTAYMNGVIINPSDYPISSITWEGDPTNCCVDYTNTNPVTYPFGTNYTLTIDLIYDTPLLQCHYEVNGIADSEALLVNAQAEQETICQFNCTQLNIDVAPGSIILWDNADSLDDPTSANPTACPSETTTYTVTVYDPASGCSGEGEVTVFVDSCCNFSIQETCWGDWVELTMLDPFGNPITPGQSGIYFVDVQWNYYKTTVSNQNPIYVLDETIYSASLTIYQQEDIICGSSISNYIASCCQSEGCCTPLNEEGINIDYSVENDLLISWDPNGAVQYTVSVDHNYAGCTPPLNCTFTLDDGETFISLADEDCFHTCQDYDITITALCGDGTSTLVTLPTFFTYLGGNQACLACESLDWGKRSLNEEANLGISIYPNPAKHLLNIDYDGNSANPQIQIFDFNGREVISQSIHAANTSIDVSNLPAAIYVVKISVNERGSIFDKIAIIK